MHHSTRKISILSLYLVIAIIFVAISAGWLFVTDGYALSRSMSAGGSDAYMDYYIHIRFSHYLEQAYNISPHACFPPLAMTFYYLIGKIGAMGFPKLNLQEFIVQTENPVTQMYLLIFSVLLSCLLLVLIENSLCSFPKWQQLLFGCCILLSSVWCMGVLERANIAGVLAVLLPLAFLLRNSENGWCRELALLCIALAAGIKIYPAVFGLLYIKEHRWKEAGRLVGYGIILFVVPFIWFGGMNGFFKWLANTREIQTNLATIYSIGGRISSFIQMICKYAYVQLPNNLDIVEWVGSAAFGVGSVVLVLLGCRRGTNWVDATLLCGICLLCPGWVGIYTVCILVLPLLMFLRETREESLSWKNIAACICFAVIFSTNLLQYHDAMVDLIFYGVLAIALLAWGIRISEIVRNRRAPQFSKR